MKSIPSIWLALAIGVALEFVLLLLGGFDLRIGGDGPASMLLFITHLPAGFLCAVLPLAWQTDVAVMVANALLLAGIAYLILAGKRKLWARRQP